MKSFDSLIGPAARAAMRDDRRIRAVISRIVPAGALEHVMFCRLAERQLRVTLDGAAWVPKLRFSERALLAELAREGLDARAVSWHVTPARAPTGRDTARRAPNAASPRAARTVLSAAESIAAAEANGTNDGPDGPDGASADDELARQLRRMARHLAGRSDDGATDR